MPTIEEIEDRLATLTQRVEEIVKRDDLTMLWLGGFFSSASSKEYEELSGEFGTLRDQLEVLHSDARSLPKLERVNLFVLNRLSTFGPMGPEVCGELLRLGLDARTTLLAAIEALIATLMTWYGTGDEEILEVIGVETDIKLDVGKFKPPSVPFKLNRLNYAGDGRGALGKVIKFKDMTHRAKIGDRLKLPWREVGMGVSTLGQIMEKECRTGRGKLVGLGLQVIGGVMQKKK